MNIKTLVRAVTTALAVPAIVACGGGGGSPSTGSSPTAIRGVSQGPITGFGSVFVNGVEVEIPSGTRIEVEGENKTERDLRIGMVVKIEWEKDASGRAAAKSVKYADDVQGPMQNINATAGTFTVLGQTVIVDRLTKFELDDSSAPISGLTALKNGDIVEVSGLRDATGAIRATRVEVKTGTSASSEFELKGIVSNFNDITKTFMIGATSVSYATANQVPTGTWGNTACAEIKGSMTGDTLVAARIKLDDSCSLSGSSISSDSEVEVEGFVTGLAGDDFKVNGQAVRVNSTTRYENGTPASLKENARIEAEGLVSNGVLVAKKVSFKLGSDDSRSGSGDDSSSPYKEIKGKVSFKGNGTVTITNSAGEIIVTVNSSTILEDGIKLDLSNLLSGQGLEVYYRVQDDGKRIAIRIHREDSV